MQITRSKWTSFVVDKFDINVGTNQKRFWNLQILFWKTEVSGKVLKKTKPNMFFPVEIGSIVLNALYPLENLPQPTYFLRYPIHKTSAAPGKWRI